MTMINALRDELHQLEADTFEIRDVADLGEELSLQWSSCSTSSCCGCSSSSCGSCSSCSCSCGSTSGGGG